MDTLTVNVLVHEYPATGESVSVLVQGLIVGVGLVYHLGPYSSALDIAISEQGDSQPDQAILTVTGGSTDAWFYPVASIDDGNGGAIADQYNFGIPAFGNVVIDVSNAVPGDSVDVTFRLV